MILIIGCISSRFGISVMCPKSTPAPSQIAPMETFESNSDGEDGKVTCAYFTIEIAPSWPSLPSPTPSSPFSHHRRRRPRHSQWSCTHGTQKRRKRLHRNLPQTPQGEQSVCHATHIRFTAGRTCKHFNFIIIKKNERTNETWRCLCHCVTNMRWSRMRPQVASVRCYEDAHWTNWTEK